MGGGDAERALQCSFGKGQRLRHAAGLERARQQQPCLAYLHTTLSWVSATRRSRTVQREGTMGGPVP